jgi:hypothetical protein
MLVPYGLNPDETWELDFAAARAKREIGLLRSTAEFIQEKAQRTADAEAKKAHEATAADLEQKAKALQAELAAYFPRSGPIFSVGAIPNGMRAEIAGERQEIDRLDGGAEKSRRELAWAEKIAHWAIRGHTNLLQRSGVAIPFKAETVQWAGRARTAPDRDTLEAYQPILHDLALLALESQRLDEAGKNG